MENKQFSVLVNSSDGFEDCWYPFFYLLAKYWPKLNQPILLNTEFKTYEYEGLNILSTQVHQKELTRKLTWSECLIAALKQVKTPLVLYMQEDYFIEKPIDANLINDFASLMLADSQIKYIGLTDIGNTGPFKPYMKDERLWIVGNGKYRISTQAALWRIDTLLSYLKPEENGWMFEIFGTQRAKRRSEIFLTANRDLFSKNHNPIMTYEHTGIIKGQWHSAMPALFCKEKIEMDFSNRGIYIPKPLILRKIETGKKLLKSPFTFIKGMFSK